MRPFEKLDSVTTPEGRELSLHRRGDDFFIQLDGEELMSTRRHGSETEMAALALEGLPAAGRKRVLIGGLGLGYTLRATLELLPGDGVVEVAELFPGVVRWNRQHLTVLGRPLDDPRVRVVERDVGAVLGGGRPGRYSAILLDVDNGPSAFCLGSNSGLYGRAALERMREALAPGGALAVWSAHTDPAFERRLGKAGFSQVRAERVRARGRKGSRHTIFLGWARRAAAGRSRGGPGAG